MATKSTGAAATKLDSFDISILGDKELQRALDELPRTVQKRILTGVMTKAGNQIIKPAVLAAVPVDTGLLKAKLSEEKFKVVARQGGQKLRAGMPMPTREAMGIGKLNLTKMERKLIKWGLKKKPKEWWYYPAHVEYGHGSVPAHSYIRKPTDDNANRVFAMIGRLLGPAIERAAARLAAKAAK